MSAAPPQPEPRTRPFENIATELEELGWSVRELARQADVAEGSARRLIAGERVRPATAKKIADALGVRVRDLREAATS